MPQPTATWNPARGVWETTNWSLCGHSEPYSETWPTSGTTRAGRAYARPTSAPLTDGSGSSSSPGLLPTPAAGNFNDGASVESWEARRQRNIEKGINGNGQGTPLAMAVQLLPTPKATDGTKGGPNQRGSSGDLTMPSAVMAMLPTPTSRDWKGPNQRQDTSCLHGALMAMPYGAGSD